MHENRDLSSDEWDVVIKEEIIPFAQELGFEFSLEELKELKKLANHELTDEELIKATGGRGEYSMRHTVFWCELVPDDETFRNYLKRSLGCNYYERKENYNDLGYCSTCKHLQLK